MSETRYGGLPEALKTVRTRPLFVMHLDVRPLVVIGATPGAWRRIGLVSGGSFEGQRVSGQVLDGGSDWQAVRADGSTTLDVRLVLKTKDDALIAMTYRGIRHGPADVIKQLEQGDAVDPSSYYFRINPTSRLRRRLMSGSIGSWQSASGIDCRMALSIVCSSWHSSSEGSAPDRSLRRDRATPMVQLASRPTARSNYPGCRSRRFGNLSPA